jgi:hypothetical protein
MAEDIKEFVHERFRNMDAKLDRVLAGNEATNVRLASIERRLTSLEGAVVEVLGRMDGTQGQLDRFGRRLDRIDRRLELSDAPRS